MTRRRKWAIAGIVLGLALLPAPLCGLLGTFFGMIDTFDRIASSETPSPAALADGVQFASVWTFVGIGLFGVGLVVLVGSIVLFVASPNREANDATTR